MTKTRIYAVLLAGAVCISLAGCGNQPKPPAESVPGSTVTADDTSGIDISDVNPAEPTAPEESEPPAESSASEPRQPAEKEKSEAEPAPEQTKPSVQTEPQKPAEPTEPQQPQEPHAVQTQPTAPPEPAPPEPEPAPTEPSKPTEPEPQEPEPIPTEPEEPIPTEPEPTQPAQPEFDVSDWVSYAQSYAQSIGLELDSEAVSCWDNPIIASANSKYLERDLCGMLDKYSRDADITAVWIWAEPRSDTSWEIYIGYA